MEPQRMKCFSLTWPENTFQNAGFTLAWIAWSIAKRAYFSQCFTSSCLVLWGFTLCLTSQALIT